MTELTSRIITCYCTVLLLIVVTCVSCTHSHRETTWELNQLPEQKKQGRNAISSQILNEFRFLKHGSNDNKTIWIVGDRVLSDEQAITIAVKDGLVIVFERRNINSPENRDFNSFIVRLKKLLQRNGAEIQIRTYAALDIDIA